MLIKHGTIEGGYCHSPQERDEYMYYLRNKCRGKVLFANYNSEIDMTFVKSKTIYVISYETRGVNKYFVIFNFFQKVN